MLSDLLIKFIAFCLVENRGDLYLGLVLLEEKQLC